jgi:hypothetical protein
VKYIFVAAAGNDSVQLFVNPTPGAAEPTPTIKNSTADIASTDIDTVYGVAIRQGSSTTASAGLIDGIRVGTTWSSILPSTSSSSSDIISGGNETVNINYASFQSNAISTTTDGVRLWSFTIRDGGGSADADTDPTILASITLGKGAGNTVSNWANAIRRAALFNGTNLISDVDVSGDTISFSGLSGANVTAADDGNTTIDLYVTFETTVTDNQQFQFQTTNSSVTAGTSSSTFTTFTATSDATNDANKIEVTASKISFTTEPPASVGVFTDFSSAVSAQDANNNTDLDYTSNVTLSKASGAGTLSSVAGLTKAAANGVASWSDLQWNTIENNVTMQAASGAFSNATSSAFNVIALYSSNSDIQKISNSESETISSLLNDVSPLTSSTGNQVWQLNIRDGGGTPDGDNLPTILTAITLTQGAGNTVTSWNNAILAADLFDGATRLAGATIGATSLAFSGLNVSVNDNSSKTLSLRISLQNPLGSGVADNQLFVFEVLSSNVTAGNPTSSSQFASFVAPSSSIISNVIAVDATKLTFTTQPPSSQYINKTISVAVTSQDANGNKDVDFVGVVTLGVGNGTGVVSATSGLQKNAAAGVVSWNDVMYSIGEANVTLSASAVGVTSGTSSAVLFIDPVVKWDGGASSQNWIDAANWNPDGLPTLNSVVILDNANVSGNYSVYLGGNDTARCYSLQVGYAGNTNTITLNLQSTNSVALKLGDGVAGNIDFAIQQGGIYINGSQASSGSTYFSRVGTSDSVKIYSGGKFINTTARSFSTPFGASFTSFENGSTFELNIRGTTSAIPSLGGRNYGNFIIASDSSGGTIVYNTNTVSGTSTFNVQNTLTIRSGVSVAAWTLTATSPITFGGLNINSAFGFATGSTTQLNITGNIVANATLSTVATQPISFSGTGNQTVSGSSSITFANGFTVANGVNLGFQSSATIGNNATVNGTLTVSNGTLSAGNNTVNLGTTGMISENGDNRIVGNVSATRSFSSPESFGGIGITISGANDLGSTSVTRNTGTAQTGNGNQSVQRYFVISPANNSNLDAAIAFQYADAELNGNTESTLKFNKSTDNGTSWTLVGGTADENTNTVTLNGVNSFSRWTVSSNSLQPAGFSVDKSSIDFGNVNVGSSKTDSVIVTNNGGDVLTVTGSAVGAFSVAPSGEQSVQIGASKTFYITFSPTTIGTSSDDVEFNHNAAGSPTTVTCTGFGLDAVFSSNTSSYNFGEVLVGNSVVDTITITNNGNITMNVEASANAPFSVSPSATQNISATESMDFYITYSPTSMGNHSDNVTFTHNGSTSPDAVSYSGTGIAPVFSIDPTTLDFGDVLVGDSKTDSVLVSNTGTSDLTVSTVASSDFSVSPSGSQVIAENGSLKFFVTFSPSEVGENNGDVIFTHDASTSPDTLLLSGNGILPGFAVTPSTLSFGNVLLGQTATDSVTISNNGTADVHVTATATAPFSVMPSGEQTINASGSMKFYISFSPTATGASSGDVLFTHDAPSSPDAVQVSGTGIAPVFGVAPSSVDFGDVLLDSLKVDGFIVSNTGTATLNVEIDTIISANGDYSVVPMSASIAAGGQLSFTLKFIPTTIGTISGTIILTHDAASSPDTVLVTGNGIDAVKFRTFKSSATLGTPKAVKLAFVTKTGKLKVQPTEASAVEAAFAKIGKNGMTFLGIEQTLKDSAKKYSWILYKKAATLAKMFTSLHDTVYSPIDSYRVSGKKSKKLSKAITPDRKKYSNAAWEQGILFKLNLRASSDTVTPYGLGALVLNEDVSLAGRSLKDSTLSYVATVLDSVMTYWKSFGMNTDFGYSAVYADLKNLTETVLRPINDGFYQTFDSTNYFIPDTNEIKVNKKVYALRLSGYKSAGELGGLLKRVSGKTSLAFANSVSNNAPVGFVLNQNYPNPFNPSTTISFDLPTDAYVTLKIYNVLGQEISTLYNSEFLDAGTKEISFDAKHLSSGMYFYRVFTNDVEGNSFSQIRKMILMK